MSNQECQNCGKSRMPGMKHRHHRGVASHKFERRAQSRKVLLKPNLHWVSLKVNGIYQRMHLCSKCLKRIRFDQKKAEEKASTTKPAAIVG